MFIEYKETGYKGYLQPYYTLEQASKELNTIIGHEVYSPEKLLQLSLQYKFNLYSLIKENFFIHIISDIYLIDNYYITENANNYIKQFQSLSNHLSEYEIARLGYRKAIDECLNRIMKWFSADNPVLANLSNETKVKILKSEIFKVDLDDLPISHDTCILLVENCNSPVNHSLPDRIIQELYKQYPEEMEQIQITDIFDILIGHIDNCNKDNDNNYIHTYISINNIIITSYDLERILNHKLHNITHDRKQVKNTGKSQDKATAQEIAKAHAKYLWNNDHEQKIRTAEMCDKVYKYLIEVGYMQELPSDPIYLKQWIKSVTPEHAKEKGRPPKESQL